MLTIAYFTSRLEPRIDWFFDSLHRELAGDYTGIRIVVVDFWAQVMPAAIPRDGMPTLPWREDNVRERRTEIRSAFYNGFGGGEKTFEFWHVPPKPTPWQGPFRRTKRDWFSAANTRNTAICLAPDGWIAFVDDLSVLTPGWMSRVRAAWEGSNREITLGAYRKVKNLSVTDGAITGFDDFPEGWDGRWKQTGDQDLFSAPGGWLFGCSLVAPVDAFLDINGYPEAWCDGLGFEDCIAGVLLEKKGYRFVYDRKMLTLEDEDLHYQLPKMVKSDYGVSPNDKSHRVLGQALTSDGWHPNFFGDETLRGLRARVLAGEPFPVNQLPEHEFFTGTPLDQLEPN